MKLEAEAKGEEEAAEEATVEKRATAEETVKKEDVNGFSSQRR